MKLIGRVQDSGVTVHRPLRLQTIWVNTGRGYSMATRQSSRKQRRRQPIPVHGHPLLRQLHQFPQANTITLHFAASTGNAFLEIKADCPVNIVVIDQYGQREGADASGNIYDEIAGATYTGAGSDPQIVTLLGDNAGSYTVQVYATGTGPFTVTVTSTASDGSTAGTKIWNGAVNPGDTLTSTFTVNSDGSVQGGNLFPLPEYFLGALAAMAVCFIAFYLVRKPKLQLACRKNV